MLDTYNMHTTVIYALVTRDECTTRRTAIAITSIYYLVYIYIYIHTSITYIRLLNIFT